MNIKIEVIDACTTSGKQKFGERPKYVGIERKWNILWIRKDGRQQKQ